MDKMRRLKLKFYGNDKSNFMRYLGFLNDMKVSSGVRNILNTCLYLLVELRQKLDKHTFLYGHA